MKSIKEGNISRDLILKYGYFAVKKETKKIC